VPAPGSPLTIKSKSVLPFAEFVERKMEVAHVSIVHVELHCHCTQTAHDLQLKQVSAPSLYLVTLYLVCTCNVTCNYYKVNLHIKLIDSYDLIVPDSIATYVEVFRVRIVEKSTTSGT
jgi:hypothetical protein